MPIKCKKKEDRETFFNPSYSTDHLGARLAKSGLSQIPLGGSSSVSYSQILVWDTFPKKRHAEVSKSCILHPWYMLWLHVMGSCWVESYSIVLRGGFSLPCSPKDRMMGEIHSCVESLWSRLPWICCLEPEVDPLRSFHDVVYQNDSVL